MQLYRPQFQFAVFKSFNQKRLARKEKRRFRGLNVYVPDFTGEGAVHPWLDVKRIKMLVKFYEDHRNQTRFTFKLDPQEKKQLNETMQNYAEIYYVRMLQEEYWLKKHQEVVDKAYSEMNNLPYLHKSDLDRKLGEKEMEYYDRPYLSPFAIYQEQRMRMMPEEEAMNFELAHRLLRISMDKLAVNE